jgi:hypothetical protein
LQCGLVIFFWFEWCGFPCISPSDGRYIYFVVLDVATDKSDEHQSLAVTYKRNKPIVIAFDVEHHALFGNERGVSLSCLDIGR